MQSIHYPVPKKQQLVLLTLLVLFSPLAIDIYLPALPIISETFHVEHALAQDTITWFLFAMGVGQLFAGPLADKLGRRTVALGPFLYYSLASIKRTKQHLAKRCCIRHSCLCRACYAGF